MMTTTFVGCASNIFALLTLRMLVLFGFQTD